MVAVDFQAVDFVVVASEAVFEAAAVVLEVVFGVAVGHQVDPLEEREREEQQQVVVVDHILIDIIVLDEAIIDVLGTEGGGILLGLDITIDHGIIHQSMLGAV